MANDNTLMYIGLAVGAYFLYQHMQTPAAVAVNSGQSLPADTTASVPPTPLPATRQGGPRGVSLGNDLWRGQGRFGLPLKDYSGPRILTLARGVQPPPAPTGYIWTAESMTNTMGGSVTWRLVLAPSVSAPGVIADGGTQYTSDNGVTYQANY